MNPKITWINKKWFYCKPDKIKKIRVKIIQGKWIIKSLKSKRIEVGNIKYGNHEINLNSRRKIEKKKKYLYK